MTPPDAMDPHERMRLRAAAFRASRIYPGPVGELISRELLSWDEFGYRLGGQCMIMRIVEIIENAPEPDPGARVTPLSSRRRGA
ncbi:MAG: hypothetical protein J2P20_09395 [Pseudonocardia sp.]|nr:hypothetical protein [Pseudonocardia sp.]